MILTMHGGILGDSSGCLNIWNDRILFGPPDDVDGLPTVHRPYTDDTEYWVRLGIDCNSVAVSDTD